MWFKNVFKKEKVQEPKPKMEQKKQQFEQEDSPEHTSILFDNTPQSRYANLEPIQHNIQLQIPLHLLHHTELVILSEKSIIKARHQYSEFIPVNFILTDRQLIISPNLFDQGPHSGINILIISLGMIQKCEQINLKKQSSKCQILLKDERVIIFQSVIGDLITKIAQNIKRFGHVTGINKFYAFRYGLKIHNQVKINGWKVYNIQRQFLRQGIKISQVSKVDTDVYYKFMNNRQGQICRTYPQLLVVPCRMSDKQVVKCASFRTKQRLPVMTYSLSIQNGKFSTLFRCSQNKVGMMNTRCKEDEFMIQCIGSPDIKTAKPGITCRIYDARGYYAALGNMISGKGYEKQDYYKNCQIEWLNIPNIHAVRDSYNIIRSSYSGNIEFIEAACNSNWYQYLYLILGGAKSIARDLLSGINVVVHCSDGWDRTAQLSSLSQILLDPYFRTIEGFAVLFEKDWRSFGHKFRDRTGQYNPAYYHPHEKSPIFIQFLDCIFQIINQFPLSFQFSESLLFFLAESAYNCVYGNFLTNSHQEAKEIHLEENTISVWSYIIENKEIFLNPYYVSNPNEQWLDISTEVKNMTIWKSHFVGRNIDGTERLIMNQNKEINRTLKEQFYQNETTILELKKQIEELECKLQ